MSSPDLGTFGAYQKALLERLLDDIALTDAVAVIGPEAQRVPIHKALLANVSEPFKKALYGEFREGQTLELSLPEIDIAAWRAIQRTAAGLNPQLTANNVVAAWSAAQMYMIKDLADECHRYIRHEVQADGVLNVLTDCIVLGVQLPTETEYVLWSMILADCKRVLESCAFLSAHSMLVLRLLKLDEFVVEEDALWLRLLEWTANLKHNTHLIGSLLDNVETSVSETSECKRRKLAVDENADALQVQTRCLQALSAYVRFGAMDKAFFADHVMKFLEAEKTNSILLYHVLGRPSGFIDRKREHLPTPKSGNLQVAVTSSASGHMKEQAERLPQGHASYTITALDTIFDINCDLCVSVQPENEANITEIQLTADSWIPIKKVSVSVDGGSSVAVHPRTKAESLLKIPCGLFAPACKWVVSFVRASNITADFVLTKVEVIGHISKKAGIAEMVRRKSADLIATSQSKGQDALV